MTVVDQTLEVVLYKFGIVHVYKVFAI